MPNRAMRKSNGQEQPAVQDDLSGLPKQPVTTALGGPILDSMRASLRPSAAYAVLQTNKTQMQQASKGRISNMATDRRAGQSLSASEHRGQLRRALIASTIGTAIEW